MSRTEATRGRRLGDSRWILVIRRLMTLTMLGMAMEWATPATTDLLRCPGSDERCYDVRDTTPQAPSLGRGRSSSTSCTSM